MNYLLRFTVLILFLSAFSIPIRPQEKGSAKSISSFVPDIEKPSVYITFERLGGKKPMVRSEYDGSERISLRLHNNMPSPIAVEANGEFTPQDLSDIRLADGGKGETLKDGTEVEVCYESEAIPQMTAEEFFNIKVPKQVPSYYSCKSADKRRGRGNVWIAPGSTLVFSVPRTFLAENLRIYTLFNYEWENVNGQMKADEPKHLVYFYSTDLPYALKDGFKHRL